MPPAGVLETVAPAVERLTQDNPGPFTGAGTNTYLIGSRRLLLLDPGPDDERHFEALIDAVGTRTVVAVVPTHSHPDHWPLAARLGEHFGAPTLGFEARDGFVPDRRVGDGEVLEIEDDLRLEALHTPGHAKDHVCYLDRSASLLFSGDLVMGWSTSVIAPPGGNLLEYLRSLERLQKLRLERLLPAHGLPVEEPQGRVREIYEHRLLRTRQVCDVLRRGPATIPAMVRSIYEDLGAELQRAAGWSLLAHLESLREEGRVIVESDDEDPLAVRYALAS